MIEDTKWLVHYKSGSIIATKLASKFFFYHLETDRQTKNANKVMKNYLMAYINHVQDNWVDYLSIAKFAINNYMNASTGVTSFFADNSFYL